VNLNIENNKVIFSNIKENRILAVDLFYYGSFNANLLQNGYISFNNNRIIYFSLSPILNGEFLEFEGDLKFTKGYYATDKREKKKMLIKEPIYRIQNNYETWNSNTTNWNQINKLREASPYVGESKIIKTTNGNEEVIYKVSKNKLKVKGVDISFLNSRDQILFVNHKEHHSKKHLQEMVNLMRLGSSFDDAHKLAMRKVGK
tara:strand:+ start:137 stop:742 length:606 start_codon:yes stop_codon:yes gene_type:complete